MSDLYPPILPSYIPAFDYNKNKVSKVRVYFALSHYNNINTIKSAQITLRFQRNNATALRTPNDTGSISVDIGQLPITSVNNPNSTEYPYYIEINQNMIKADLSDINQFGFQPGVYYKLQIRLCHDFGNNQQFNPPMSDLSKNAYLFSEWSSVCVLKAIEAPTVLIKEFDKNLDDSSTTSTRTEYKLTAGDAEFYGIYKKSTTSDEVPYTWRMKLYLLKNEVYTLIGDSGDTIFNIFDYLGISSVETDEIPFKYNFKFQLEEGKSYKLEVKVVTKNGYECKIPDHDFDVTAAITSSFTPRLSVSVDNEDAFIKLHVDNQNTNGNYMITVRRTSSESNFENWEDITNINVKHEAVNFFFYDYAIKSGVLYKYGIQTRDNNYRRSAIDLNNLSPAVMGDFQYAYLLGSNSGLKNDAVQLKLMYDVNIGSFTTTVMESKIDTIGSKYPFITRNGDIYYRTFPITGLISYHMNEKEIPGSYYTTLEGISGSTWNIACQRREEKNYKQELTNYDIIDYNNQYIPYSQEEGFTSRFKIYESETNINNINRINEERHELTKPIIKDNFTYLYNKQTTGGQTIYTPIPDNPDIYYDSMYDYNYEREFREKVMEFLYNDKPKLFKSASEGNILVKLMDISFTPKQELGRLVYEFSATAYEIDEPTLDILNQYGIQTIKPYEKSLDDVETYLGQLSSWDITFTDGFKINDYIRNKHHIEDENGWNGVAYRDGYLNYLRITFESPPYLIDGTTRQPYMESDLGPLKDSTKGVMGWIFYYGNDPILVTYPNNIYEFKGDNVKIPLSTNISFPKAIDGTIDYLVTATIAPVSSLKVITTTEFKETIGQIYKTLQPFEDFISNIRGKYELTTTGFEQSINSYLSIDIEADPGAVFYLQGRGDEEMRRYVINFTGNLLIDPDVSNIIYTRGYFTGFNITQEDLEKHTNYDIVTNFPSNVKELDYCTKDNQMYIYYKRQWRKLDQVPGNTYDIECPIEGIVNYYIQTIKGYY